MMTEESRRFWVMGTGPVAESLASLGHHAPWRCEAVLSRGRARAERLAARLDGARGFEGRPDGLAAPDLLLLAVRDDALRDVAARIATWNLPAGAVVAHCAGAHGADLLRSAAPHSQVVFGSLHPMQTFPGGLPLSRDEFEGSFCAVEGEAGARETLAAFATHLGGKVLDISAAQKPLYHAIAAFACSGVCALLDWAQNAGARCGLSAEQVRALYGPLMRRTLRNAMRHGPQRALTGPIARGDLETLAIHREAVAGTAASNSDLDFEKMLYLCVTMSAVQIRKQVLPDETEHMRLLAALFDMRPDDDRETAKRSDRDSPRPRSPRKT